MLGEPSYWIAMYVPFKKKLGLIGYVLYIAKYVSIKKKGRFDGLCTVPIKKKGRFDGLCTVHSSVLKKLCISDI